MNNNILPKVVVAMSGGVDSSTVAGILSKQGYTVIGITLQLYNHGLVTTKKNTCCAGQDIYDAKMVASKLNIPHYVLDYESQFQESVINDFIDSYLHGETPIPCIRCNQFLKFQDLLNIAKKLGASYLATGHYVRKIQGINGAELHTGIDLKKDQSYFLFTITKEQLDFLLFPLGELTKIKTREIASDLGLLIHDKPDSQDICFIPDGNYKEFISKSCNINNNTGTIMHVDGYVLGVHNGILNFTIGQRKGLGISFQYPLYVVKIDHNNNIVYVGPESALKLTKFIIKDINWIGNDILYNNKLNVQVKIRSTHLPINATIEMIGFNKIEVQLEVEEKSITPGQACVIYDKNRILGGGWITNLKDL